MSTRHKQPSWLLMHSWTLHIWHLDYYHASYNSYNIDFVYTIFMIKGGKMDLPLQCIVNVFALILQHPENACERKLINTAINIMFYPKHAPHKKVNACSLIKLISVPLSSKVNTGTTRGAAASASVIADVYIYWHFLINIFSVWPISAINILTSLKNNLFVTYFVKYFLF